MKKPKQWIIGINQHEVTDILDAIDIAIKAMQWAEAVEGNSEGGADRFAQTRIAFEQLIGEYTYFDQDGKPSALNMFDKNILENRAKVAITRVK